MPCGSSPRAWGTHQLGFGVVLDLRFIPTRVGNTDPIYVSFASTPVHPHARGEHGTGATPAELADGSSPRAWGTLIVRGIQNEICRFSPTRGGNTPPDQYTRALCRGSSPRAWGTLCLGPGQRDLRRFIPTRVGNTFCWRSASGWWAVHPHARGEHWGGGTLGQRAAG